MYETQFGFSSRPFPAAPNAGQFFPTEATRKAFGSVVSCIERAAGAAIIVGGSGLGKSVFLQAIGRRFQQDFSVAILESASLESRKGLLQSILFELGLPYRGMEEGELKLTLMDYLKPSDRCPNGLLLCVDEAHLLSVNLMEELRMMTNLVRDGKPLTRLVLAGNVSIEERLADPKLESLCQRISTRAYLESMNATECRRYIEENINSVSERSADLFENDAMEAVYLATHGVPRLVNQVCDQALVMAVNCGVRRISEEMINEAWSEIQRLPVEWHVLGNETESNDDNVVEFGSLDELPDTSGRAEDFTQNDANPESNLIHEESPETEFDSESKSRDSGCGEPEFNSGGETQLAGSDREDEPVIETFSHVDRRSIGQPAFSTEIGLSVDSDLPDPDAQLKDEIPEVPASELQVQKPIEDRISQAVSDLTKEISRSTDPGEAITDPVEIEDSFSSNDDRDMIIVQDEPSSGPVETVPIQEIEVGETSTQAKREDYHRLFDRLRNG